MNTTSASLAEDTAPAAASTQRILVWDAPVRVFHWLAVLCFAGAWLTADGERWRVLHVTLGYTLAGLVAFRLLWGLIGTRHARFASFLRRPAAAMRYLGSLLRGRPEHHVGHNPAGALAIVALLALAALVTFTGWAAYEQRFGAAMEELHEGAASAMLALVVLHVAAVAISSWLHRENLVRAMITGRKPGVPRDGILRAWRGVGVLMLLAVLAFWWQQWHSPAPGAAWADRNGTDRNGSESARHVGHHHDDDD